MKRFGVVKFVRAPKMNGLIIRKFIGTITIVALLTGILVFPQSQANALPDIGCVRWHLNNIGLARSFAPQWYQDADRFTSDLSNVIRQLNDPRLITVGNVLSRIRMGAFNLPYYFEAVRACWR